MKLISLWSVLCTLLPFTIVAATKRVPVAAEVGGLSKRAGLVDSLFGERGNGPRYWAWAKLAYDSDYNEHNEGGKDLGDGKGKPWEALSGSKIFVRGVVGTEIDVLTSGETNTGMKAIVGVDHSKQVIVMAFMGTSSGPTAIQDLKFDHVGVEGVGVVHKGFYQCFASVEMTVFPWTQNFAREFKDYQIVVTGHSLGGATAHIAAVAFAHANPDLKERMTVFTYGAPRAGDLRFQQKLQENQSGRMANFRHISDPFPELPLINMVLQRYANPSDTWTLHADGKIGWFNKADWEYVRDANENKTKKRDLVSKAAEAMKTFLDQHTGYFTDGPGPLKRSLASLESNKIHSRHLAKRATPEPEDYESAIKAVNDMIIDDELGGNSVSKSNHLEQFAEDLKITNEWDEFVKILSGYETQAERLDYLRYVEIAAMNIDH